MKYSLISSFLIIILISLTTLSEEETQRTRLQKKKSIHQLQWEQYRDYQPLERFPEFEGPPRDLVPKAAPPSREIFGYLPYWRYNNYPFLNYDLLTTVAYFGVDINEFGNIVNFHNWPATALIDKAHGEGVRVVLTAILFNGPKLNTLLSTPAYRTNLVNNLLTQVQNANADGVTIDFEGVPGGNRQNLTDFMAELTTEFHQNIPGSFVTIFTPAVDWSNVFDYLELSEITDGLIMQGYDYHWRTGPTAGPVAPLTGGTYNVSWTVSDYLFKTLNNNGKLMLAVPFYGYEWPTEDGLPEAATTADGEAYIYSSIYSRANQYGREWHEESQTPWYNYNSGGWFQGWYDDSLSLSLKYDLVNVEDLKGIAIWALSYDGSRQELQGAISDAFGASAPPLKPTRFLITNLGDNRVRVSVPPVSNATNYKLYSSTDPENFDAGTTYPGASIELINLSTDSVYYFKMSAVNGNGESDLTKVLAVRPSPAPVGILIVDGFDRISGTVNTFDYIKRFAPSVSGAGFAFDSGSNEAVENGDVSLRNYPIVIWISGEEAVDDESFSNTEQLLIADYLEKGGKLFISGSEIGYDLWDQGSASDQSFYHDYFKAEYVRDKVPSQGNIQFLISGTFQGIFSGLANLRFDDGNFGTYRVDWPDGIRPVGGADQNLVYTGFDPATEGGAGIQYEGLFGQGEISGKLVYLAVGFETIYPRASRDSVMIRVLNFFDLTTNVSPVVQNQLIPEDFRLSQNYPNPFNPVTQIDFKLPVNKTVSLKIYNTLGQKIRMLINHKKYEAGIHSVKWDATDDQGNPVASGVYIYQLVTGDFSQSKSMILMR